MHEPRRRHVLPQAISSSHAIAILSDMILASLTSLVQLVLGHVGAHLGPDLYLPLIPVRPLQREYAAVPVRPVLPLIEYVQDLLDPAAVCLDISLIIIPPQAEILDEGHQPERRAYLDYEIGPP